MIPNRVHWILEQSLGGPAEEGAPSPRLSAVVGGEKTAGMRREAAQGQMISSVSDQSWRKTGKSSPAGTR